MKTIKIDLPSDLEEYKIYKHTAPNGKCYIGITKQKLNERWRNGEGYKRCTAFYRAIKKYGWDNILHEVIDFAFSLDEANEKEIFYIQKFQSHKKEHGYNCTDGGDGVCGWQATEEQKRKNSEAKIKFWKDPGKRSALEAERKSRWTEAERRKHSDRMKEKWKDEVYAAKTKEALKTARAKQSSEAKREGMKRLWLESPETFMKNKVYKKGAENKKSKPVMCIETGVTYANGREASEKTGVDYRSISACATGRRKTANGTHWEYV